MVPQDSLGIAIIDNTVAAAAAYDEQKAILDERKKLMREKREDAKLNKDHLVREQYLQLIIAQINLKALSV